MDPTAYTPFFCYRAEPATHAMRHLFCERVPLEQIARRVGTPVYVYSRASIEAAYRRLRRAFSRYRGLSHTICYSVKANSNLSILRLLARLGSGFDIVSGGELYRLLQIGVAGRRIVFSGVGKTREEIREALRAGVLLCNVESEAELELLAAEAGRLGRSAPACVRVNPDIEAGGHPHIATGHRQHKFGMDWQDARRLYLAWKDCGSIRWQGISAHIGSQILNITPFRRTVTRLADYVLELARAGIALKFFDFGGGIGVRYWKEQPLDLSQYASIVSAAVQPLGCHLLLEPGRVLLGPAGILLTQVLYTKRSRGLGSGRTFVVVDAAMNDFLRPALYGAVHPITAVVRAEGLRQIRADIVGPVCETGDCFLQDWLMEEVRAGDLLAIWGTGAYGFVSASNYNSRPRPAEVLVENKRFRIIRRRESRADLVRGE